MSIAAAASLKPLQPDPTAVTDAKALQRHAKLVDAAQKFEGMMLQELLTPMKGGKDGSWGGDDDPEHDGSMENFSSYGVEAVANAIAKDGGLGIAKQVLRQIGSFDVDATKKS